MSNYTIQNYWKQRLDVDVVESSPLVKGWSYVRTGLKEFREAPITLSQDFGNGDPNISDMLLVSAPGAVGKTTLAQQIAYHTGAIYIDLAAAAPVGGNTISGGLLKSRLNQQWDEQRVALLIDGLDEARLRVTQEAFEAFLRDVAEIARNRNVPTVLFGRTGAVQDAWLMLDDANIPVLEIGYFDIEVAIEVADAMLAKGRSNRPHAYVEKRALELLLRRLREQTEHDGDRFAGYAPVLQAVAKRVEEEENPQILVSQIEKGDQPVTLRNVVTAILERERVKLSSLLFEDSTLVDRLYSQTEQLERLVARVYRLAEPGLPSMSPRDAEVYEAALQTWVGEHPLLDGNNSPSSVVFDAVISSTALHQPLSAEHALRRELARGVAANPFLAEFYINDGSTDIPSKLPSEHIGIIYASLRARISLGDSANLSVEGTEDGQEEDVLRSNVEITLSRREVDQPRTLYFVSEQVGTIHLGSYVEDVDITVPHCRVEIGPGSEAILVAPINIQCNELNITTEKVIVESAPGRVDSSVFLQAEYFNGISVNSVPVLRGDVTLAASWPNVRSHPWTGFASEPTVIEDPRIGETLRRLRKFVISFRSHSKGNLARYRHKIEHERMTKGSGRDVLNLLKSEQVLKLDGAMYFLDPGLLQAITGLTYSDCMAHRFNQQAITFAQRAIAG